VAAILVTGGTGTVGRPVVERLRERGADVRVLSRHGHGAGFFPGDLATGEGVAEAVEGVDVIVHCAGGPRGDEVKTRNLVRAAARAGAPHVVSMSVVGADRIPVEGALDRIMFGYFAMKLATERIVAESGLPWTVLRATQFYDLVFKVAEALAKLPVVPMPRGLLGQPVDSAEVADRLVELAESPPLKSAVEVAGPKIYKGSELVRGYLRATGKNRVFVPMPLTGEAARAFREGAATASEHAPEHAVGHRTWEEFLAGRAR
jgi:uncharacterized protein YbjT (DUF2867 family)